MCIKNDINSIKLCLSLSQGLKIQVVYFQKCSSFWGTPCPGPPAGLRPWTHWGISVPDPLIWPQLHLLDPPLLRSALVVSLIVTALHKSTSSSFYLLKYNQIKHSSKYINMSRTYQARTCTYGSPVKVCAQSKYK